MAPRLPLTSLESLVSNAGGRVGAVSVGGVVASVRRPLGRSHARPARAPSGYLVGLPDSLKPSLRWLAQKDSLAQDALLLTSPAERSRARSLALAYAELVNAELEYVAISADTTEADLKQRRELMPGGSVSFSDSPPVRAALHGRILLLDGLERAERNVLPTLNNLLENRELSLDDGRFLIDRRRYDNIDPSAASPHEVAAASLVPVHELFRVIALASPSPPFPGRALDPPLRSRFQALLVPPAGAEELTSALAHLPSKLSQALVASSEAIAELERQANRRGGSQTFFSFSATSLASHCSVAPLASEDPYEILKCVYPPLGKALGNKAWISGSNEAAVVKALAECAVVSRGESGASSGSQARGSFVGSHFRTPAIASVLSAIRADMSAGRNVLIVAGRGCGKSALVRSLQEANWRTFVLHRDLTARDLLQRRVTDDASGASGWADQPCTAAARTGSVVVLDGLHRLPKGAVVAALGRLCVERELDLPDGTRLVDAAHLALMEKSADVSPLLPEFRIVALAEPGDWLTPEIATLFSTHALPDLSPLDVQHILEASVPSAPSALSRICEVAEAAATTHATSTELTANEREAIRLTPRVLLRVARRMACAESSQKQFNAMLHNTLMSRFLPSKLQDVIDGWLRPSHHSLGRKRPSRQSVTPSVPDVVVEGAFVRSGCIRLPQRVPLRPELVPAPRHFFGSSAALQTISTILECEHAGERAVLLIGNQGVGKNVAVDRVLQLLRAEREYVQLHRDTTVSSLTVQPVLEHGQLRYEDAPLVRAAKYGRICVLDEADKAPTEVVIILKALVEDGDLLLGDGRRLLAGETLSVARNASPDGRLPDDVIPVHEDFRLWVLANRPGFPFHGNAFFRECGDVFAAVAVDNPDVASETALLEHVAPTYPNRSTFPRLAHAFSDLRSLAEKGSVSYPYSMREAVAVARHLEKFPNDSVAMALANVFAYEAFDAPLRRQLADVFERHKFENVASQLEYLFGSAAGELGTDRSPTSTEVIEIRYLPEGGASTPRTGLDGPKHGKVDPTGAPHVGGNTWAGGTGGSDTAGLGGRGGPYRLSDGNPVYQISDEAKAEVSEEARARARQIAEQAWRERLAQIEKMDESMWEMYHRVYGTVEPQISQLHAILEQAKDKKRERVWLRNRSDGELDDSRLVEGVAGDRLVFKRRGRGDAPHALSDDASGRRKRHICFVMDCSGSMYRFNGFDGRLNRMLEVTCLIMESMERHLDRYEYAIVGHSGDTARTDFVEFGQPPATRAERLKILQKMVAHTQFCWAGDHTIEATHAAIDYVLAVGHEQGSGVDSDDEDDDDDNGSRKPKAFVVVLSDANFRRYGIDPSWWSEALVQNPSVECHAVMIGSLGEEANAIVTSLPPGRGHIVMDTALLPSTFRSIFEQAGLFGKDL